MAKLLKLRRGTTTQHGSFTGAEGEVTIDTTKDTAVVHDGSTAGGRPLARQDMNNVPAGTILGTQLENSGVTAGQYGSSSAIPIVTVDAQGLVTAASTTAIDSTTIANGTSNVAVANNGDITATRSGTARFVVDNGGVVVTGGATISGSLNSGDVTLTSTQPKIVFNDSNDNPDYQIENVQGVFKIRDNTNSADRLVVNTDGHVDVTGNLDVGAGLDVTGDITATGSLECNTITNKGTTHPQLIIKDTDSTGNSALSGFSIRDSGNTEYARLGLLSTANNQLYIGTTTNENVVIQHNSQAKLQVTSTGADVTGNITVSGTVDGRDVAADGTLLDGLTSSAGILKSSVTTATQPQSNNSTKVATTAYVRTAITEASPFPSGTKMLFQQTSAPTGWTKQTSGVDNKALRVVSGTASSGGTNAFSNTLASRAITANSGNATAGGNISVANTTAGGNVNISSVSTSGTVNSHTLTINEIPSHGHNLALSTRRGNSTNYRNNQAGMGGSAVNQGSQNWTHSGNATIQNAGGGGGHSHGFTGSSHNHTGTLSGSAHSHNATFSGSAHNHSISVTNLDMAVQYLDVIIAAKD